MVKLRETLPKEAILVGWGVMQDVNWLNLKVGEDFAEMRDLAGLYRVWNDQYKSYTLFSQDHVAKSLLGWDTSKHHDAVGDATKSIRLFNLHTYLQNDEANWNVAQRTLLETPPEPSFAKQHPTYEGVCMGNRKTCKCGAPFFFT